MWLPAAVTIVMPWQYALLIASGRPTLGIPPMLIDTTSMRPPGGCSIAHLRARTTRDGCQMTTESAMRYVINGAVGTARLLRRPIEHAVESVVDCE